MATLLDASHAFTSGMALAKPCPLCNGERGYSQTQGLRGLDEILQYIRPLFNNDIIMPQDEAGPSGVVDLTVD